MKHDNKIELPLFLRSIEEKKISYNKDENGNEYCYSQKYQGYCILKKSTRWKSIAISLYNNK
jgi:hypothetical protein